MLGQEGLKYKIIMVGDPYVGKTAIFMRFTSGQNHLNHPSTITTIDFKIKQINIQNKAIKLYIWDTAGQQKYRSIVSNYFKGCDGVMLVFDLTSPASFTTVTTKWYELAKARSPDAQLLLVGNKSDMDAAFDQKQAQLWAKDHGAIYVRASVKRDVNVEQCFRLLSQAIYRQPKREKTKSMVLHVTNIQKNRSCC